VRAEAIRVGLPHDDKRTLQILGQQLVTLEAERFCNLVLDPLRTESGIVGVLDGLRHRSIFDCLGRQVGSGQMKLIFVEVDDELRHQRLSTNRGWSAEQCREYDNDPTEWELDSGLRPLAHCVVVNSDTPESALAQIETWHHECSVQ